MVVNLLTLCAVIDVRKLTSEAGENELGVGFSARRGPGPRGPQRRRRVAGPRGVLPSANLPNRLASRRAAGTRGCQA